MLFPGSGIKTLTLIALLEAGKINDQTALTCQRSLIVGGHQLDCTHPDVRQPFGPATALAYSCKAYFAPLAMRLTPAELDDTFVKFRFAPPVANRDFVIFSLNHETSNRGLAPNEAIGKVARAGTQAELQLESIGESSVHLTPLQLLRAYQRVALLSQTYDPNLKPVCAGLEGSVSYGMGHLAQPTCR